MYCDPPAQSAPRRFNCCSPCQLRAKGERERRGEERRGDEMPKVHEVKGKASDLWLRLHSRDKTKNNLEHQEPVP
ncbi:hypothetical protein EYF80_048161 [Liparis tanakae]|uniref:Uncharacterized protein n=1 Tax=Liparis tanakae TaxID=230148 RepID=A0A4Z2FLN0_9TELE|nr:hypothetical protein EYF80_048161 [Liparis tanakae]